MSNPKVSVIMSVFNAEDTIEDCIESILSQTFDSFELLIVNDASTDNTHKLLEKFSKEDKRIKVFINSENIGLTKSLNSILSKAKGKYIARQDADDISLPKRFEKQIEFIQRRKYEIVVSRVRNLHDESIIPKFSFIIPSKILIRFKNPFIHGTLFASKDLLERLNFYNEEYYYAQDYELFSRILKNKIKVGKIWEPLYLLNTKNNISSLFKKEQKEYADKVRKIRT